MQSKIVFLCLLLCVLGTECVPNIIVLLADDMGYGDAGFTGNPTIRTPNLDRMAAQGMRFNQFYTAAPICSPARASLLTGRLPVRNGVYSDYPFPINNIFRVFWPFSPNSLPSTEITLAQALKQKNYTSACIGKWHIGHHDNGLPTQKGFDHFFGLPYSPDEGCPPGLDPEPMPCEHAYDYLFPGTPLYRNITIIEQPVHLNTIVERYNTEAIAFMDDAVKNNQSFFLYMAYDEVHVPLFASERFLNTSLRGLFGDAMEEMDHSVGLILEKLVEWQIDQNTLVFFTSDNGPWKNQGINGGSSGQFRGEKGETLEGGMREPTIVWWPGTVAPGSVNMDIGSTMDIFVTALDVAGIPLPTDRVYDGVSLLPALTQQGPIPRECYFYYRQDSLQAVRCGSYKAQFISQCGYCVDPPVTNDPPLLFNVDQDFQELYPINSTSPQYQQILEVINEAIKIHNSSLVKGPPNLNGIDFLIMPCCDHRTQCYCQPPYSHNFTISDHPELFGKTHSILSSHNSRSDLLNNRGDESNSVLSPHITELFLQFLTPN